MSPDQRYITDLAELRTAIRRARIIDLGVYDDAGKFLCFVRLSKKEAVRVALESDRLDDYAAQQHVGELTLGERREPGLREFRAEYRRAQKRAAAAAVQLACQRAHLPVPADVTCTLAA